MDIIVITVTNLWFTASVSPFIFEIFSIILSNHEPYSSVTKQRKPNREKITANGIMYRKISNRGTIKTFEIGAIFETYPKYIETIGRVAKTTETVIRMCMNR